LFYNDVNVLSTYTIDGLTIIIDFVLLFNISMFDFLIIGAGFPGSVLAEELASKLNKKVLIIDKRGHIGGNAFDHYSKVGTSGHQNGPHWFHTNDTKVFNYLSKVQNR